jgi:hypothetical protein
MGAGLFQIVGPMAFPSATDLNALEEDSAASIQSLPSRRLAGSSNRLSMLAGDVRERRPSLEAQLRPIDSKTARGWLPTGSKSRLVPPPPTSPVYLRVGKMPQYLSKYLIILIIRYPDVLGIYD